MGVISWECALLLGSFDDSRSGCAWGLTAPPGSSDDAGMCCSWAAIDVLLFPAAVGAMFCRRMDRRIYRDCFEPRSSGNMGWMWGHLLGGGRLRATRLCTKCQEGSTGTYPTKSPRILAFSLLRNIAWCRIHGIVTEPCGLLNSCTRQGKAREGRADFGKAVLGTLLPCCTIRYERARLVLVAPSWSCPI